MSENTAFSPSGEDVITRTIDVALDKTADTLNPKEFDEYYDIHETQKWIVEADYRKVWLLYLSQTLTNGRVRLLYNFRMSYCITLCQSIAGSRSSLASAIFIFSRIPHTAGMQHLFTIDIETHWTRNEAAASTRLPQSMSVLPRWYIMDMPA